MIQDHHFEKGRIDAGLFGFVWLAGDFDIPGLNEGPGARGEEKTNVSAFLNLDWVRFAILPHAGPALPCPNSGVARSFNGVRLRAGPW